MDKNHSKLTKIPSYEYEFYKTFLQKQKLLIY